MKKDDNEEGFAKIVWNVYVKEGSLQEKAFARPQKGEIDGLVKDGKLVPINELKLKR